MNKAGIELLKEYEGFRAKAYIPVPGDVPTIGFGHTEGVKMGDSITRQKAEALLKKDIEKYERGVEKACTVTPNENQLAALTCLAYNIGLNAFSRSTVLKAHNRGDEQSASRAFGLWNKSSGVAYAGLTRRRASEAALYLKPVPEEQEDHPMPQRVEEERPLTRSPISLLSGGAGATGALGFLTEATEGQGGIGAALGSIRSFGGEIAGALGMTPLQMFCLAITLAGVAIAVYRWRQRNGGWT